MADVANLARVSVSSVSHVLNGTRPVRESTRCAVLEAVVALDYTPNAVARSLRVANTRTLGVLIGGIGNPYFTNLIHSLEVAARRAGYTLLLGDSDDNEDREAEALSVLLEHRVAGIVFAPSPGGARAVERLNHARIPFVQVDRVASYDNDFVITRNATATRIVTEHLATLGHTRIAFVRGVAVLSTTKERLSAFLRECRRWNGEPDKRLIVDGFSLAAPAAKATYELMTLSEPPTAIFSSNNLMTLGVMEGLNELGLTVPGDIALVSFDDFDWADLFHPRLTAIAQPHEAIGEQAVRILLDRIAQPDKPPARVRLTPVIRHRDSCGCGAPEINLKREIRRGIAVPRAGKPPSDHASFRNS